MVRIFNKFISLLFIASLFACSNIKELKQERQEWDFKNWDRKFKERTFCLCQLKGFENKNLEKELWRNDKSYYSPLGVAIFDDQLELQIKKEIETIRLDSIKAIGAYPNDLKPIFQKRNVANHCLEFYNSKRLDSLTQLQNNYWKRIPNIMNEIHLKIPTF